MTKKKTDETMISSEAVENNTEMEEIIDVSEEVHSTPSASGRLRSYLMSL